MERRRLGENDGDAAAIGFLGAGLAQAHDASACGEFTLAEDGAGAHRQLYVDGDDVAKVETVAETALEVHVSGADVQRAGLLDGGLETVGVVETHDDVKLCLESTVASSLVKAGILVESAVSIVGHLEAPVGPELSGGRSGVYVAYGVPIGAKSVSRVRGLP